MIPQPQQQDNLYRITRWDLEEYYDAIALINGKPEADRMWERIERNTRPRPAPSPNTTEDECLCNRCHHRYTCPRRWARPNEAGIAAKARNQTLDELDTWCRKEADNADEGGDYVTQSIFCNVSAKIESLRSSSEVRR